MFLFLYKKSLASFVNSIALLIAFLYKSSKLSVLIFPEKGLVQIFLPLFKKYSSSILFSLKYFSYFKILFNKTLSPIFNFDDFIRDFIATKVFLYVFVFFYSF